MNFNEAWNFAIRCSRYGLPTGIYLKIFFIPFYRSISSVLSRNKYDETFLGLEFFIIFSD